MNTPTFNLNRRDNSAAFRLRDRVVVITGASSGIGRATARAFADHGSRLVLAARNEDALQEVCGECVRRGARAIVVRTDVTDAAAMAELAKKAVETFGQIDVWINNAGVGLFGPFTHAGMDAHRRVVEINLFGAMNGAAAALPYFLEQHRGVLITNISLGGFAPVPFAAAYTAGKFGLRGFMAGLRQELANEPNIHVCSLFPAVVDTPGFEHGANVSDAELTPGPIIFPPEKVAQAMVAVSLRPRAETSVGWPVNFLRAGYGIAPLTTEKIIGMVMRHVVRSSPPAPRRIGNLFEPSRGLLAARGGWIRPRTPRQKMARSIAWVGLLGAGGALLAAHYLKGRRRRAATSDERGSFALDSVH